MKFLLIFLLGVGVLIGAIVLNILSSRLGFTNWYEFFRNPGSADMLSYLWLFVLYPLGLGIIAYGVSRLLNL